MQQAGKFRILAGTFLHTGPDQCTMGSNLNTADHNSTEESIHENCFNRKTHKQEDHDHNGCRQQIQTAIPGQSIQVFLS